MMRSLAGMILGVGLLLTAPVSRVAVAEEKDAPVQDRKELGPWSVAAMVQQAAKNIARRYDLNPEQEQYTTKMLSERVTRFLDAHQREIWPLVREVSRLQIKGEMPDPDAAKKLGEQALPLMMAAQEEIVKGNEEWRGILDDKQKQIHDGDMSQMKVTFNTMNQRLEDWKQGKVGPNPFMFNGEPPPASARTESRDPRVGPSRPEAGISEEWWDSYVRRFIATYKLDKAQAEAAASILRECKQRARDYRDRNKEAFEASRVNIRTAVQAQPKDSQAIAKAYEELNELRRPITDLFKELKTRLDTIPTQAQIDAVNARTGGGSPPAQGQTTQPATTQPTTTQPATAPTESPTTQQAGQG